MKKFISILAVMVLCFIFAIGAAMPAAADSGYNYGQGKDLTGVGFAKITQADIVLDAANPGVPAFVKTNEVSGYLWDLNFVPVREMPPVFAWVWVGGTQIAQVRPIYNYGQNLGLSGVECAKVSQADLIMDQNPSNVGIPIYAQKAIDQNGNAISGYAWDLNYQPVVGEIPPIGSYIQIGYGQTLNLAQVK